MSINAATDDVNVEGPMKIFWGESPDSISAATQVAVKKAENELPEGAILETLVVTEIRGSFNDAGVLQFRTTNRIGYRVPNTK